MSPRATGPGTPERRRPAASSPEAAIEAVRDHLWSRGSLVAVLGVLGVTGAVLLVAWFLGGGGWRPGSIVPFVLVVVGLVLGIVGVLLAWSYVRRWTDEGPLTGEVERNAGLPAGSLQAQLELDRVAPEGVSGSLIRAGARALLGPLSTRPAELAGRPGRDLRRMLRLSAIGTGTLAFILLVLSAWAPERSRTAWSGLVNPAAVVSAGALGPLQVSPGNAVLPRGSVPRIRVWAGAREQVTLHWQGVGEPLRDTVLYVEAGEALGRLPPLEATVRYWATAPDGARTPEAILEPSDPLLLTDLTLELRFPDYTRLPPETLRGAPTELSVPEGTRITVSGRIDADEGTAVVLRRSSDDGLALRLPVTGRRFQGAWRPWRSESLSWEVEGAPDDAALPGPLELRVEPDRPPEVGLPVPGGDGELPASFRLPLLIEAVDDHGVAWVEVQAVRMGPDGVRDEPVTDRIPVGGRREASLRPVLDVTGWGLAPGDLVLLLARAADGSPRVQIAETPEFRLRVPSAAALREAARELIDDAGNRVEEMADRARGDTRELDDLSREARMGRDGQRGNRFQDREELRTLAAGQERMMDELDELRGEMEEARRALEGAGDEDAGLRERLQELEGLLAELADPEERARMEELLERLASGERTDAASELEEMARAREELRERLEDVLERLRREALEQNLAGSEEELRSLAEAQEEVAERLRAGEDAAVQDSVAERAEAMEARLDELTRRLEERGEPEAAARADQAGETLSGAREGMERAADAARSGDTGEAGSEAEAAAEQAREALEQMEQAHMEWLQEWQEQVREALRRSAEDALALARRQAEVRERIPGAGAQERARLQGEEASLLEGVGHLANRVTLATRQAPAVGREVTQALGQAHLAMERTVEGLHQPSGARGPSHVTSAQAIEALNRAALLALAGMEQVGQQAGGSSMDEMMQELEALASQQEQVNQDAQSMSADPQAEGASSRMEEMAQSQASVAGALEQLAQRPGGERTPGDLEELAREARELARELDEGRLDGRTLERQEALLNRLLAAGRTLEQDAPTEEREGTAAGDVERRVVDPLSRGLLGGLLLPLPGPEELARLSPAERRLVLEYFERLNRRAVGGGEPGGGRR